jgi:hypothetical protein
MRTIKFILAPIVALAILVAAVGQAEAVGFRFDRYGSYVDTNDKGLIMEWKTNPKIDDKIIHLDLWEKKDFKFGWVNTHENWVNYDDTKAEPMTAHFSFNLPEEFGGQLGGTVQGWFNKKKYGTYQGWEIKWDDYVDITFNTDGCVRVWLEDASWYEYVGKHCDPDMDEYCAAIWGKIKLIKKPTPIPLPATLVLMGSGLLMMGRRIRRSLA